MARTTQLDCLIQGALSWGRLLAPKALQARLRAWFDLGAIMARLGRKFREVLGSVAVMVLGRLLG